MADVGVTAGELLLIMIGDGGSPEVFAHPCLINTTRGLNMTVNTTDTEVADCTTPANPAYTMHKARSTDFSIDGAGKMDATSALAFVQWWAGTAQGTSKNVKINQSLTGANGGWNIVCPMILKDFSITGDRGDTQDVKLTLVPSGKPVITANA